MTRPRAIVLGYTPDIHAALSQHFDLVHVIADGPRADIQWWDVHGFRQPMVPPSRIALNDGTFEKLLARYQRFADINSRRYVGVNERESEIFNGFSIYFYWAHRLLTESVPDVLILSNLPHEGFDFVLYHVARELGIATLASHQCVIPDRFWICEDVERFGDFAAHPAIAEIKPSHYDLPETWFYMRGATKVWTYTFAQFLADTMRRPWRLPATALRYYYERQYRAVNRRITKVPADGDRFIYVPLHMQPELTSSAMGGPSGRYADQAALIEQLSQWIPKDVWIYVKDNPKQTSMQRGPLFYRRLGALPNVRMVRGDFPSRSLIAKSIGVATTTGTAGWEALFLGRPVLAFGNAWYLGFPGVSPFEPSRSFEEWVDTPPPGKPVLVQMLDDLLTRTGHGIVDQLHAEVVPGFSAIENAKQVALSLATYWSARTGAPNWQKIVPTYAATDTPPHRPTDAAGSPR